MISTISATAKPDFAQLIDRIKLGDASAQNEFVQQFRGLALRVTRKVVGENEADEVATDALTHLVNKFRRGLRPDDPNKLPGYVKTAIRNYALTMKLRKRSVDSPASLCFDPPAPAEPSDNLSLEDIAEPFSKLDKRTQEILRLTAEGFTYKEIASKLGISDVRVSQLANKGVERIQEWLRGRGLLFAALAVSGFFAGSARAGGRHLKIAVACSLVTAVTYFVSLGNIDSSASKEPPTALSNALPAATRVVPVVKVDPLIFALCSVKFEGTVDKSGDNTVLGIAVGKVGSRHHIEEGRVVSAWPEYSQINTPTGSAKMYSIKVELHGNYQGFVYDFGVGGKPSKEDRRPVKATTELRFVADRDGAVRSLNNVSQGSDLAEDVLIETAEHEIQVCLQKFLQAKR